MENGLRKAARCYIVMKRDLSVNVTISLTLLYYSMLGGEWSQEGCQVLYSDEERTICQCDHLTNFAVLMDVSGTKVNLLNNIIYMYSKT